MGGGRLAFRCMGNGRVVMSATAEVGANAATVRALFEAYRAQDLASAQGLLGEKLTFTSPQDDHIDRAAYLDRCFPTASRFRTQEILEVQEAGAEGVFLLYEYELESGARHRNTEFITVRAGQVIEIQVFFGGQV